MKVCGVGGGFFTKKTETFNELIHMNTAICHATFKILKNTLM